MNFFKKKIRILEKKIFTQNPRPLIKKINNFSDKGKILINKKFYANNYSFGKLNPDKIFYVIRRSPGAGLFSNWKSKTKLEVYSGFSANKSEQLLKEFFREIR